MFKPIIYNVDNNTLLQPNLKNRPLSQKFAKTQIYYSPVFFLFPVSKDILPISNDSKR